MSSRDSSTATTGSNSSSRSSNGRSTLVSRDTYRSHNSKNHLGERIERESREGQRTVTYIHNARGFEYGAPTPSYRHASTYGKK